MERVKEDVKPIFDEVMTEIIKTCVKEEKPDYALIPDCLPSELKQAFNSPKKKNTHREE